MLRSILLFLILLTSISSLFAQDVLWANRVVEVSSEKTDTQYSPKKRAIQILGKPNVYPQTIISPCAWQPSGSDFGEDYIHVAFEKAIVPHTVAVAETFNPGAIVRIFGYTDNKEEILLYQNSEGRPKMSGRLWQVPVDPQGKQIESIKLLINHMVAKGIKQFDAIAMSTGDEINAGINLAEDIPENIVKENLGPAINSRTGEVAPIITPDGKTLFFTRLNHPENLHDKKQTSPIAQDIWYSKLGSNGEWDNAANIGPPINNIKDNAAATVSIDGKKLFILNVYRGEEMDIGLSKTVFSNGKWSYPEEVKIDYFIALKTKNQENNNLESIKTEFSISHDEKVLLMGLKRPESFGEKDIYVSFLKGDGSYSKPLNLGPTINSADDEVSPFLSIDKKTLYFNSRGHSGYGNGDIFVTQRLDSTWTNWSEPKNLGPNINSPFWDGYFTLPASGDYAYLSTSNSSGDEDIFKLSLFSSIKPNPVALIKFKIQDDLSKEYFDELPEISCNVDSIGLENIVFDYDEETQEFSGFVPIGAKYSFKIDKSGFMQRDDIIDLSREKNYIEIDRVFSLTPLKAGQKMILENVEFDQGKYNIKESSHDELEKMIELMRKYPEMMVLLEGYTDNQGDFSLNVKLAKNRVDEVKKYMVTKGQISANRITTKSWGPLKPLSSNATPEMRKKNRRVEFTVISM